MATRQDLTGERFGGLTVLGFYRVTGERSRHYYWSCRCDCGKERVVDAGHLKNGHVRSCGCRRKELVGLANTKHGATRGDKASVEYTTWQSILARCHQPNRKDFARYGGMGVTVCDRWSGSGGFEAFLADMGPRPAGHSIDRIDNAKGYAPDNCRWATAKEQARNKKTSLLVDIGGETMPLMSACEARGLAYQVVYQRISKLGWSVDRALSDPVRRAA